MFTVDIFVRKRHGSLSFVRQLADQGKLRGLVAPSTGLRLRGRSDSRSSGQASSTFTTSAAKAPEVKKVSVDKGKIKWRSGEEVTQPSAKRLCRGSIPLCASKLTTSN